MFIMFGFGHKTVQQYGSGAPELCRRCNNAVQMDIVKVRSWFMMFFVPLIPYKTQYVIVCPICRNMQHISKEEFERITKNDIESIEPSQISDEVKYAGKTPTQIAYLKQMEAIEESRKSGAD